jgi:predicted regulator of Ras-like GTPase activity (Roadblock/LC7/MglB family)
MTTLLRHDAEVPIELVDRELRRLRNVVGVRGALVSTVDGRTVSSDMVEKTPGAAAAITASSLGLARRLSDLTDPESRLEELQARTSHGYVCLYAIGESWLLAVLTDLSVNLARLKLDVRESIVALSAISPALPTIAD